MSFLTRRRVLAAKIETTYGAAESLTNAEAGFKVEARDLQIVSPTAMIEKEASGGCRTGAAEAKHTALTFVQKVHGKGGAGVPKWASTFFPSAAMLVSSQTYNRTWDTANFKGITVGHYVNGLLMKGRGMMGNLVMDFVPGQCAMLSGDYLGGYVENPTDTSILTGITYEDVVPPIFEPNGSTPLTIDGQTIFKPAAMQLDWGNVFALRPDPNAEGGFLGGWVTSGCARWTLDPEAVTRATYNWFLKHSGNSTFALSLVLNGGTNNTITIGGTFGLAESPRWSDREGKLTEALVLYEVDDTLNVVFT